MIDGPVLVVAAHPDDEVLGCGGTIARCAAAGTAVHVLLLSDGVTARGGADPGASGAMIAARQEAARAAADVLGALPPRFEDLPDNRFDSVPLLDIVKRIEAVIAEIRPATVFTHHGGDLNIDHSLAHRAVLTACRPQPGATVRGIYCFETVSSTEWSSAATGETFRPVRYVGIAPFLDSKLKALDCYAEEMRAFPHARSRENVANLARLRGASVGLPAAEAFEVAREIVA